MKNYKAVLILIIVVLLASLGVGCGIPQEQYDQLGAQLRDSQAQVAELSKMLEMMPDRDVTVSDARDSFLKLATLIGRALDLQLQ